MSKRHHHFELGEKSSTALGAATVVSAKKFQGFLKVTVKVCSRKRRDQLHCWRRIRTIEPEETHVNHKTHLFQSFENPPTLTDGKRNAKLIFDILGKDVRSHDS